ncbi:MAG: thermonuclease family protein [Candidatus Competibacter sp.]|nr:thermonuclease family protein [Candidatus Competibacter sp.]
MTARALAVLLLLVGLAGWATAAERHGRVVAVADGDTLTLAVDGNEPIHIRLAGIDAPEHDQPFGPCGKQSLVELAFGETAAVAVSKIDDYGRGIGVVVAGVDMAAEQVRRDLAWVYRYHSDDPRLLALAAEAKAARRGLWADANPIPPWEWRHGGKAMAE